MSALLCSLAALLLAGGGGGGAKFMETVLQDDALLLHRPAPQVRTYLRQMASMGVTRVRITAGWSALAPEPTALRRPARPFDETDSRTYPQGGWRALDRAVVEADRVGLPVMLDIAFWAPRWAVGRPATDRTRERWWPSAKAFGRFATAVAARYSGGFPDPSRPGATLPAVRLYTPWNEPNHPAFLMPQWRRDGHGGYRPASPHIYRAMYEAAYAAIKRVDPRNLVLLGGTASKGSSVPGRGGVPPLEFVRALACVDERLRPLRVPECKGYTPLRADGYAHHPYSRETAPAANDPEPDNAPLADSSRLTALLDRLEARGRLAQRLDLYDTEYGYQSRPPSPYERYSPLEQAQYLGWATYLAWREPRTRMFAQFLLRDIDPDTTGQRPGSRPYWTRSFHTGLFFADGRPKPAAVAFQLPFWAELQGTSTGRAVLVFGQVRPGSGHRVVRVERQDPSTGIWAPAPTVGSGCEPDGTTFLTDAAGFLLRLTPYDGPASYRLSWLTPSGQWLSGVPIAVDAAVPVALGGEPARAPGLTG